MQHVITEIFEKLGGVTAIARGIGSPVQTVDAWLGKGRKAGPAQAEIPPWRRADVLKFARDDGKLTELSPECLAYLQSQERSVGRAA